MDLSAEPILGVILNASTAISGNLKPKVRKGRENFPQGLECQKVGGSVFFGCRRYPQRSGYWPSRVTSGLESG